MVELNLFKERARGYVGKKNRADDGEQTDAAGLSVHSDKVVGAGRITAKITGHVRINGTVAILGSISIFVLLWGCDRISVWDRLPFRVESFV